MRYFTNCLRRIKLEYFFMMAKLSLKEADKHIDEDAFWTWMKVYGKYSRKYFELYGKVGL